MDDAALAAFVLLGSVLVHETARPGEPAARRSTAMVGIVVAMSVLALWALRPFHGSMVTLIGVALVPQWTVAGAYAYARDTQESRAGTRHAVRHRGFMSPAWVLSRKAVGVVSIAWIVPFGIAVALWELGDRRESFWATGGTPVLVFSVVMTLSTIGWDIYGRRRASDR